MRCQDRKVPHMSGYHEHEECTAGTRLQRTHTCLRNRSNMDISSSQGNSRACLFEITDTLACMLAVKQALWQPSDWRRHLLREAYAPAVYRRVSQLPIRPAFLSHVRTWHKACASTVRVVEKIRLYRTDAKRLLNCGVRWRRRTDSTSARRPRRCCACVIGMTASTTISTRRAGRGARCGRPSWAALSNSRT